MGENSNRCLNVAIIGAGSMGQKHYKAFKQVEGAKVVGVVEPQNYDNFTCPVYKNTEELLRNHNIDCAVIATPTSIHLEAATPLIEKNKHLLIEKPLTKSMDDANTLKEMVEAATSKVAVGYVERFNPAIQAVAKAIKGETIISCEARRVGPYPSRITDVGVKLDLAVHDVDLVRFLTGQQITQCDYVDFRTDQGKQHEDNITLFLKMDDGACATINSSWSFPFRERKITVLTSEALYVADMYNCLAYRYAPCGEAGHLEERLWINREDALKTQLTQFVNYVINGEANHLALLDDGIESLKAVVGWDV